MSSHTPLIGICADRRMLGNHAFHCTGEKYIDAVARGARALPLMIPSLGEGLDIDAIIARLDGLLLTGSPSNVEPHHYQGPASDPGTLHDSHRDATTLPLIRKAIDAGVPILAICRGFQEMNVAFGGSLHQKLHEVPGFHDHRDDELLPLDEQYGPAHEVQLQPDGVLYQLAQSDQLRVNSLHWQGVEKLGTGLAIEARAPDGVIEAFRVINSRTFAIGVQWHPEWKFAESEFSRALFAALGAAAKERSQSRGQIHGQRHGQAR